MRYILAVAAVVAATLARNLLDPFWGDTLAYFTFWPTVVVVAWFGGLGPGLLATVCSTVDVWWLVLPPRYSFALARQGDVLGLALFAATGAAISVMAERARRSERGEHAARAEAERLSEERRRLLVAEQRAREHAEVASRAKDEFLATVSHELRTPLNAILGWARMLQNGLDADRAKRAIDVIARNAGAQTQLIEDLLDIARITTGKMRLDVQAVEPIEVVRAAVDAVRPAATAKEIRIQTLLDPRAGPVSGDPDRLQQVVWNVLTNAVKFTPKHGRVQVRLEKVGSHVAIVVSDTGIGIAPDVLPHVFDMFRQADGGSTRGTGGLGLGLALVKHLVEQHGGTIGVESPGLGEGAIFRVQLPLLAVPAFAGDGAHPVARIPAAEPDVARIDGVRVLVVDDNRDTLELLSYAITAHGGEARTAASAAEALGVLDHWLPAVVLCDIEMPGEDGYAFVRRLRSLPLAAGGAIPAIAITAYGRAQDRIRSLREGFAAHIAKPAEPGELLAVITAITRSTPL